MACALYLNFKKLGALPPHGIQGPGLSVEAGQFDSGPPIMCVILYPFSAVCLSLCVSEGGESVCLQHITHWFGTYTSSQGQLEAYGHLGKLATWCPINQYSLSVCLTFV
jgi:hypothetical protein